MKTFIVDTNMLKGYEKDSTLSRQTYNNLIDKGVPEDWFRKICDFEGGDWVYDSLNKLFRITEIVYKNDWKRAHGHTIKGTEYTEAHHGIKGKATKEEVEKAFTEESIRRGYEVGKKVKSFYFGQSGFSDRMESYYDPEENEFYYKGTCVFQDRVWAEIIKDSITVNGYEFVNKGDHAEFGCMEVTKQFVHTLDDLLQHEELTLTDREGKNLKDKIHQISGELDA